MRLNVIPQETFFFRDARPFDQGEGWAGGIFPPLPSTFYGACRTVAISQRTTLANYYNEQDNPIRSEMGSPDELGSFRLRSLLPWKHGAPFLAMPRDLVESVRHLNPLIPFSGSLVTDQPFSCYHAEQPDEEDSPVVPWLYMDMILAYLRGENDVRALQEATNPVVVERKTGIRKNRHLGTTEEHMLYTQDMLRMRKEFSFSMEVDHVDSLDDQGFLRTGHDGRLFVYEKHSTERHFDCIRQSGFRGDFVRHLNQDNRFRLLFTSPAILAGGWLPASVDEDRNWHVDGLTLKIESVVLDRPLRIGGWDWKKKRPKPMYRALPPGSVYYCRLLEGDPGDLFDRFFDTNFCDQDVDLAQQGFGHVLLGIRNQ